jgi:2-oxoglutarate ferredoxin oxidoreductase subunit gamma
MYRFVMEKIGKPIVFNIFMLGTLIGLTDLVRSESIMKVLENRIPSHFLDMNQKAIEAGLALGKERRAANT